MTYFILSLAILWIIWLFYIRWRKASIDQLSGREFELMLRDVFEGLWYRVQLTEHYDYGADLILTQGWRRIAVQAKHRSMRTHKKGDYTPWVGFDGVQKVYAAKAWYDCDEAWVVTQSTAFAPKAIRLAEKLSVRLISRTELLGMIPEKK